MNQISIFKSGKQKLLNLIVLVYIMMLSSFSTKVFAQNDTTNAIVPEVKEESTLIAPSIEFISVQKGDSSIDLEAAIKAKVKGSFTKLSFLKISFVQISDTAESVLGFVITDRVGKAVYTIRPNTIAADKDGKLHFKAVFAGNKAMDAAEEELTIKRGILIITPVKDDSILSVHAKLVDIGTGKETAVPEAALGIFVKRLFNSLKVGEGTTDKNGESTFEIQKNLPGDESGKITLQVRLDDNEIYGNMESSVIQPWGIPVSVTEQKFPRSLWSTHPPLWMMITFIILITIVWGHYLVIIFELFRLRKEQPKGFESVN